MASLAMVHEKSIFGFSPDKSSDGGRVDPVKRTADGEVVNTTELGGDILGYGGTVPLEIYITDGRIDSIKALPNNETNDVFQRLYDEGLMTAWNGLTHEEAAALEVDGVTGATYSSNAVIGNVRSGISYVAGTKMDRSTGFAVNASLFAALIVVLADP